jgi:protein-tyrosine phosphatase
MRALTLFAASILSGTNASWIASQPAYLSRDYMANSSKLRDLFSQGAPSAAHVRQAMADLYRDLPYQHAESFRTMFKSLAAGEMPLSFNCAAGKDRTGVAAALLLTLLGVPESTVLEDYALSEKLVNYEAQMMQPQAAATGDKPGPYDFLTKLPVEVRAPLLRSDPAYLKSALDEIEKREGSIDNYFGNVLNLSAIERDRIRESLLDETLAQARQASGP